MKLTAGRQALFDGASGACRSWRLTTWSYFGSVFFYPRDYN